MTADVATRPDGAGSEVTARAIAFVAARLPQATVLGRDLAAELGDPTAFLAKLASGLMALADPAYREAQAWLAPGARAVIGVRWPLVRAIERGLRRPLADASPAVAIYLADALSRDERFEVRLFSHVPLRRSLADDPERSWQIVRRLARAASDWISVDALAGIVAQGLLLEPFRWAEIEQLVYSPHRWERRLAASTLAEAPHRLPRAKRPTLAARPGLAIVGELIGDDDPDVQKALSWALRSWRQVDPGGVAELLRRETSRAIDTEDGARAWVLRDALTGAGADEDLAAELRPRLAGLRRRPGAANTSRAFAAAAAFASPETRS
ncbi:MAG: DNA alkylation repair protein [Candidatus Limnocylindrales bacterium]